ncbi:MAG: sigma-70 family RNA polymerase sigma factor [Actinobacteria bacterium]|nr:sigma-70 family RNA polymerase sigma factor [Actinomycetota bacterium]
MRPSARVSGDPATALAQRVVSNKHIFDNTAGHMRSASTTVRAARSRGAELLVEAREAFLLMQEALEIARSLRRVSGPDSPAALTRYTRGAPDPIDELRQRLHEAYAATGDPALRAQLMDSYDGFARSLALRFRHRESLDDLVQVARIGLLHAIDRFDPALGRPFPLFARITISGELKRHIRDKTWGMRVPRSLQEDYLNVMQAVDELTAEHSDSPSMEAIATRCALSVERVVETMELRLSQRALSIDMPAGSGVDDPVIELGQEDIGFRQLENRELLAHLLARLPERDRRIIELRFIEELTQSEIADKVGVSQMCVSRVLARTLGRLRLWGRTALG